MPIRLSWDFSAESLQSRREWNQIFKLLKKRNYQPRITYSVKLSFRHEGERKTFSRHPDAEGILSREELHYRKYSRGYST